MILHERALDKESRSVKLRQAKKIVSRRHDRRVKGATLHRALALVIKKVVHAKNKKRATWMLITCVLRPFRRY